MNGTVKFYNERKRFGFITGEDDKEIFVHESGLSNQSPEGPTIQEGDTVEYEIKESERGPVATNVRKITLKDEE